MTGASFIVLNGALKSSSGLTAKSSIIEDGIMVQVSQDRMLEIRKQLGKMEDVQIDCGPVAAAGNPDETVLIKWIDKSQTIKAGIKSMIDGRSMDGVSSVRMIHSGSDFAGKSHLIRWTEVFLLPNASGTEDFAPESPDPAQDSQRFCQSGLYCHGSSIEAVKKSGSVAFCRKNLVGSRKCKFLITTTSKYKKSTVIFCPSDWI